MIDVLVWKTALGWKAYAPQLGVGTTADTRSETLRQLRRSLHDEMEWGRELRIIGSSPDGELND